MFTRLLADDSLVFGMCAHPESGYAVFDCDAQRAIGKTDPDRVEPCDALEAKRGMRGIILEQPILLIRKFTDRARELVVTAPEPLRGVMLQIGFVLPARCSSTASFAKASSLPAATSDSISLSQAPASISRIQFRNWRRSSGDNFSISLSSFSTLVIRHLQQILPRADRSANGARNPRGGLARRVRRHAA